ncbi:lysine N(6)-hydroxylase/L-ornithine N(5)-oxygenase family protein [Yinghuangia seranimata]|uniref:lysine N(6)-hydroxylase/L-ornithine N(5)-oxygenase family protein n=1 Tax=Yinghuangia seranimata TaxID=408067 RepID=UPI00248D15F9|nr:SidA/IucD/PvdA family monooxygenase [Yinghuangia seranimata]MDI2128642.1 SidA/IucD/PvdA family monooxygenase [Yinghuangia seranimata]
MTARELPHPRNGSAPPDPGTPVHDLVGIGIGPFNLALAALADRVGGLRTLFLERTPEFRWHPGLLVEGATLQVPFLADLVTLVDPTSPWSFLAYLRAHDRLFPFYFAERFHVTRREYDHYCRWVADALPSCRFGADVTRATWDPDNALWRVVFRDTATGDTHHAAARHLVLGIGTEPVVPAPFADLLDNPGHRDVLHSADYLDHRDTLTAAPDVTVIGSGQSGAEVFLDLLRRRTSPRHRINWLTRSPAFAPMEYSKIGLEHFTPDYTRYFHGLAEPVRDRLVPRQAQLYKAVSADTLAAIHDELYERGAAGGRVRATLMPGVSVTAAARTSGGLELGCHHSQQDRRFTVLTDKVVLATGYAPRRPDLLEALAPHIRRDRAGRPRIGLDHRVALDPRITGGLYVQNAELHTHGVGTPDLGLGAHRAAVILNAVCARAVYRLPARTAYTTFGLAPDDAAPADGRDTGRDTGGDTEQPHHRHAARPTRRGHARTAAAPTAQDREHPAPAHLPPPADRVQGPPDELETPRVPAH